MSEKREQIIETALKLFCENGFQNTSTALISREAGVATGTLFIYFPVKEELITTLYIESKNKLAAFLKEGISRQKTPKLKMKHLWLRWNEWAEEHPYAFKYIQMVASSTYISGVALKKGSSVSDIAEKFLLTAIKDGTITRMSASLFFTIFEGLLTSTANHIATLRSAKSKEKIAEQSFEIFWKGVSR
jgi:AcrR family transcriptional regulator